VAGGQAEQPLERPRLGQRCGGRVGRGWCTGGEQWWFPRVAEYVAENGGEIWSGYWSVGGDLVLDPVEHFELDKAEEGGAVGDIPCEESLVGNFVVLNAKREKAKGGDNRVERTKDDRQKTVVAQQDMFEFQQATREEKSLGFFEGNGLSDGDTGDAQELLSKNAREFVGTGSRLLSRVTNAKNVDAFVDGVGVGLKI
jgi:hypothetical protein